MRNVIITSNGKEYFLNKDLSSDIIESTNHFDLQVNYSNNEEYVDIADVAPLQRPLFLKYLCDKAWEIIQVNYNNLGEIEAKKEAYSRIAEHFYKNGNIEMTCKFYMMTLDTFEPFLKDNNRVK